MFSVNNNENTFYNKPFLGNLNHTGYLLPPQELDGNMDTPRNECAVITDPYG